MVYDMRMGDLLLQRGAFLAAADSVEVTSTAQRSLTKGLFSGVGFFVLHARGTGPLAFGAYGSVHVFNLVPGELRKVDNGNVVAWTACMPYTVDFAEPRSILSSITSGEGLMCHFQGPGTVWVASRSPSAFSTWLRDTQAGGGGVSSMTNALPALLFGGIVCLLILIGFFAMIVLPRYSDDF